MKRQSVSAESIEGGNKTTVENMSKVPEVKTAMGELVLMLGEVADAIAQGDDIFITFGANKKKTALVWTLSDGGVKTYAAGHTFVAATMAALEAF